MKKTIGIASAAAACILAGCGDYMHSNRCVASDTNHTFTRAVIRTGMSNEVVQVVAWKDYLESDSIQLWVKDPKAKNGMRVVYTHLSNVILENPDPECPPSFNKFLGLISQ